MTENILRVLLPLSFVTFCIYALYVLVSQPFQGYVYLAGFIFLELLAIVIWNFQRSFFAILLLAFLWAGTDLPLQSAGLSARWVVLAAGAAVGFVLYLRGHHSFRALHLLALFCIVSALVSAMVSTYPRLALLKTASLFLIFLYSASGGRLNIIGREAKFIAGLLLGCEVLVYFSAFQYFVRHVAFFGNPNSLGAVTGIATTPVLLWGAMVSESTRGHPRRMLALIISVLLVLSSYSRAGIGACVVSCFLLCLAMRRYRLLVKGAAVALAGAFLIAATVPLPDAHDVNTDTIIDVFLYKGKTEAGILGSRESPWQQTSAVIRNHPWFGSGFGTSDTGYDADQFTYAIQSMGGSIREHGNSYLAILEWVGILGVVPFLLLVLTIVTHVGRSYAMMFRTAEPMSPLIPITGVLIAGLIHAAFEDWMFAPGYYVCVFFWTLVFIHADLLWAAEAAPQAAASPAPAPYIRGGYGVLSPGQ
jgi:O-antigen ligase